MYLKTPKRYRIGGRRRQPIISARRLLLWALLIGLIVVGIGIYENSDMLRPEVETAINNVVGDVGEQIERVRATPLPPTPDPTNDLNLANNAWMRGAMSDVIRHYTAAMPAQPNDLQLHYRLTMALINQGQIEEAALAAQRAITASPYSADAWAIQAMALNRQNRSNEAIASALRALELVPEELVAAAPEYAPTRARALAFLAEAYLETNQSERAATTIEQALTTYPDSFEALQVSGRINAEVRFDFIAAREDYEAAYDLEPNMPYLGIWLARTESLRFQNYDRAIALYLDVLENNPDNPTALYDLGSYYLRTEGNPDEALTYYNRCVENSPDNADCHWMRGRTLLNQEAALYSPDEALSALQRAYELDNQNGYYIYWLAQAHMALGQCDRALPLMENGSRIGQQEEDENLVTSFEAVLPDARRSCGVVVSTATPPPDAEGDTESEVTGEEDPNL
ncbi:MAG: tetratricopeptide repeat protein [Chloroflexota bacterium]